MPEIEKAFVGSKWLISVIGEHAGEGAKFIFDRKQSDINQPGKTFWLIRSGPREQGTNRRVVANSKWGSGEYQS